MYVVNEKQIISDRGIAMIDDIRAQEEEKSGAFLVNVKRNDEDVFRSTLFDYEEQSRARLLSLALECAENTLSADDVSFFAAVDETSSRK